MKLKQTKLKLKKLKTSEKQNMKTIKLTLTALAGALLVTGAPAQVEINISGAVAFRDTSYRAIRSLFLNNGTITSQNPADGPGAPNQLKVTWTGTITNLYGNQTVTVRAFYNGANAGIQDLAQDRNVAFLASSIPGNTNLTSGVKSDIAYSSVFQASTAFTSPVLADAIFGVTPVFFVKSTSAPAAITNITVQQFRALAANGKLPALVSSPATPMTRRTFTTSNAIRRPGSAPSSKGKTDSVAPHRLSVEFQHPGLRH